MDDLELSREQLRMARAGIDMQLGDLAKAASVSINTIAYFERGERQLAVASRKKLVGALSRYVVLIPASDGEHGPGVLLREGVTAGSWRNGAPPPTEIAPPTDPAGFEAFHFWRTHPEMWGALPVEVRAAQWMMMLGFVPEQDPFIETASAD